MWPYDETEAERLARSDGQDRIMAEARRLRAEALALYARLAFAGIARLLRRLAGPARRWYERQNLIAELSAMTDHQLADIGLNRGDISAVADGTYSDERGTRTRRKPLLVRLDPGIRRAEHKRAA